MHKIRLAKEGEERAANFLRTKGYKIIERNYRSKFGEIDIIAKDKDVICFIEVKTRRSIDFGLPKEALIKNKRMHIIRAALIYLKKNNLMNSKARFDVVSIIDNNNIYNLELLKDVFCLDGKYSY